MKNLSQLQTDSRNGMDKVCIKKLFMKKYFEKLRKVTGTKEVVGLILGSLKN